MEAFLGTIIGVGFSFAPRDWMICAGQTLPISMWQALYAVIGTQYGGDGVTTFGLPDLRGRVPVGQDLNTPGRIPGANGTAGGALSGTFLSTGTGSTSITLTVANLPAHNHGATFTPGGGGSAPAVTINASNDAATTSEPVAGSYLAVGASDGAAQPYLYSAGATSGTVKLNAGMATVTGSIGGGTVTTTNTGGGTAATGSVTVTTTGTGAIIPPFQTINYIICVSGIYPTRN